MASPNNIVWVKQGGRFQFFQFASSDSADAFESFLTTHEATCGGEGPAAYSVASEPAQLKDSDKGAAKYREHRGEVSKRIIQAMALGLWRHQKKGGNQLLESDIREFEKKVYVGIKNVPKRGLIFSATGINLTTPPPVEPTPSVEAAPALPLPQPKSPGENVRFELVRETNAILELKFTCPHLIGHFSVSGGKTYRELSDLFEEFKVWLEKVDERFVKDPPF